jgi:hypothetical protein
VQIASFFMDLAAASAGVIASREPDASAGAEAAAEAAAGAATSTGGATTALAAALLCPAMSSAIALDPPVNNPMSTHNIHFLNR